MTDPTRVNVDAIKSEIRQAIINQKANACPMAVRVAWHASGTFDARDGSGGSNGATTRFEPESTDDANAGLSIIRDLLQPIHDRHPEISLADLWTLAGACAVEFLGGPAVPHKLGRADAPDGSRCPPNGRIPDASQGAAHLREMFYRMGLNDKEIVALSGGHTLGRCHLVRSGYDGKWTANPLKFDNSYFQNLMFLEWRKKDWPGKLMYEARDATGDTVGFIRP
jgi:catalase (peroxidase I)